MPVNPAFGKLRQEDCKPEARLARPYFKGRKEKGRKEEGKTEGRKGKREGGREGAPSAPLDREYHLSDGCQTHHYCTLHQLTVFTPPTLR
jgi:hypothetical protein